MKKLSDLEKSIGYEFKNKDLLRQALLHKSYANEHKRLLGKNNERLEFLGDAVLQLAVSEYLFRNKVELKEGELSKLRASIVCESFLYKVALRLELGQYIKMSKGTLLNGGENNATILSDAIEAILGAISIDSDFEKARGVIHRFILSNYESNIVFFDSKSELQERLAQLGKEAPCYRLIDENGPEHNKIFTMEVYSDMEKLGIGVGNSKKKAEMAAALDALDYLKGNKS